MCRKYLVLSSAIWMLVSPQARAEFFRLPVLNTDGQYLVQNWVIGVDHDPVDYGGLGTQCVNYEGKENFPYCYDQHSGSDFILEGGFETMDAEVAWVVAAAEGEVVATEDGNYDRCHADIATMDVSCDGYPMEANYVIVEHASGMRTFYWHLKADSIVVVPGQSVTCGEQLGLIGSSGYSSAPHLHFSVDDAQGNRFDPYAGVMSQPESYWVQQDGWYGLPGQFCEDQVGADSDGDGLEDPIDNCPYSHNPDQDDADGNGMGDTCDPDYAPPVEPDDPEEPQETQEPQETSAPGDDDATVEPEETPAPEPAPPSDTEPDDPGTPASSESSSQTRSKVFGCQHLPADDARAIVWSGILLALFMYGAVTPTQKKR